MNIDKHYFKWKARLNPASPSRQTNLLNADLVVYVTSKNGSIRWLAAFDRRFGMAALFWSQTIANLKIVNDYIDQPLKRHIIHSDNDIVDLIFIFGTEAAASYHFSVVQLSLSLTRLKKAFLSPFFAANSAKIASVSL